MKNKKTPRTPSQAQMDANRRNAQHSSGPRTQAGKAASSRNRLVHGLRANTHILLDEDPADFQALLDDLLTRFQPSGEGEEQLVLRIAASQWRLARAFPIEAGLLRERSRILAAEDAARGPERLQHQKNYDARPNAFPPPPALPDERDGLARAFSADCRGPEALAKLTRYENSLERSLDRSLKQLKIFQAARQAATPEPKPAPPPDGPGPWVNQDEDFIEDISSPQAAQTQKAPVDPTNCHSNPNPAALMFLLLALLQLAKRLFTPNRLIHQPPATNHQPRRRAAQPPATNHQPRRRKANHSVSY